MSGEVKTPEGSIILRAPTEVEAIAYEDKRRAARRPRPAGEEVTGSAYDNGLHELLACVTSPDVKTLDPDDGLLSVYPGIADRMATEFRRLGGWNLQLEPCEAAVSAEQRETYKRRVLGFEYGGTLLVVRRMTYPEYTALQANQTGENFYALAAAQGRICLLSHQGDEQRALFAGRPYLAMDIGLRLLDEAMGVAETKAGKSASASSDKTPTSTSPPATSSAPATASAGAES